MNEETLNRVRIEELEKRMDMQITISDSAVKLAANDLRARLEAMNEFRAALRDQATNFITRREMELKFEHIDTDTRDRTALWIAIGSVVVSILLRFIK